MNAYAAVYALIAAHQRPPHPRAVYQALGCTKKEYYAALRWLERYGFIARLAWDKRWIKARIRQGFCQCGVGITPQTASYRNRDGKLYIRRICANCHNAQQVTYVTDWNARNPGYHTRLMRRQRQQRSAS